MFLEIDMGNTRIKWRLRDGALVLERGFFDTKGKLEELEQALWAYSNQVRVVWVASVVNDDQERKLSEWVARFFSVKPVFARSCASVGVVKNGYSNPALLGVDRWLSILAAYNLLRRACIVLSFGTAATVDVIDRFGNHLGGFIAPGLALMVESLVSGTHRISIGELEGDLNEGLGVSTSSAVCGGCTSMLMGLIDNAIRQLRKVSGDDPFDLVFAGGDAARLMPFYPHAQLINDLVLDGLGYAMQGSSPLE
jgi:type III pantothenate kinase